MQNTQGLQSLEELADARYALAMHGRYGDTTIGHLTPGEMVLPRPIADDPVLKRQLFDAFERHELNPNQYQVGHFENSINPLTGVPEFGFFKKIGKFLKKVAPEIGKIVGFIYGGPAGAAIGGGLGATVKYGGDIKQAAKHAATGYMLGSIGQGAGLKGGQSGQGIGSLFKSAGEGGMWGWEATPAAGEGVGAFFQNVGAKGAQSLGAPVASTSVPSAAGKAATSSTFAKAGESLPYTVEGVNAPFPGAAPHMVDVAAKIPSVGESWSALSGPQKMGVSMMGLGALGGFEDGEDTSEMPPPSGELDNYLQRPLTAASLPTQYGIEGVGAGGPGSMLPTGAGIVGGEILDPATAAFLRETLDDEEYSDLMFPEFKRTYAKNGGPILSDGETLDPATAAYLRETLGDEEYSELMFPEFKRTRAKHGGPIYELDLRGGGASYGPGTGTSDDVPAMLSDGEFVMTKQSVMGMGDGDHKQGIEHLYTMMQTNENKAKGLGIGRA
jgi:hypothetical protein|tara:strand:- start:563 stop:2059 length:1497 start_codon:yes stop_codon:yes gene_type:complete